MSVSSPCEICQVGDVDHTCDRCGRLVCADHFDEDLGLCTECSAEMPAGRVENVPDDVPDDVDTYRF